MKRIILFLAILLFVYSFNSCCSCKDSNSDDDYNSDDESNCWSTSTEEEEEDDDDDDCFLGYAPDDCETNPPNYGTIHVDITKDNLNPVVPIIIFKGDFELGKVVLEDELSSDASYTLPNGYYSVKAEYKVELDQGLVTVYSIDGWDLDYDSDSYCDDTCYEEGDIYLDARLNLDLFENP